MKLSKWLSSSSTELPMLGKESFNTFLKVCSHFAKWALDDISLATKNDKYKIWSCPVKSGDIKKVKAILERYTSMKKILKHYNESVVENKPIIFFMSLNYINNKWNFEYGLCNGNDLFIAGEFEYTMTTNLPKNEIVKYISSELKDFNSREHLLLYKMRKDLVTFNPGYCQITEPIILNRTIILTVYNLGLWNDNGELENGEKETYLEMFLNWAKPYKWAPLVTLIVRPKIKNSIDFIIKLK